MNAELSKLKRFALARGARTNRLSCCGFCFPHASRATIKNPRSSAPRSEGKIPGAYQEGRGWKIPVDAKKPADGRYKSKESLLVQIDRKKVELDARRPWRIPQTSGSYYERTA